MTGYAPVVVLSSINSCDRRDLAYSASCDNYMGKSLSPNELLLIVDTAIADLYTVRI